MTINNPENINHFNFLRMFAAFLVFYGHAHVFLAIPLHTIFDHTIGLYLFFSISGYLISMSWDKDPSLKRFFINRSLRIFPALIVVTLLSVFLLGPIMTTWTLSDYFINKNILLYLKNVFLYISYALPGVFENNAVPNAVNGSLWSLPAEFFMYILVVFFGHGRNYTKYIVLMILLIFVIVTISWATTSHDIIVIYGTDLRQVFITGVYFWAGALMYHWNVKQYFSFESFALSMLCLIFLYQWNYAYTLASVFLIPFAVLSFGFSESKFLSLFNKSDYSYGFYIYAFPVQQSIVYLYPHISFFYFLSIGFIITLIFAALSWHLIENPMLRIKVRKNIICQETSLCQ